MLIAPKTVECFGDLRERLGTDTIKLLGTGESSSQILMMELSKNLFGAKGEYITSEAFHSFKANGKLTRLKKSESISCKEVKELETTSASSYSRWTFKTEKNKYTVRFQHHPGGGFKIDKQYIPGGSSILWELLGQTLRSSLLESSGLGDPGFHKELITSSLGEFIGADVLVYDTMKDISKSNPFILWSNLQQAFAMLVAGNAVAGESKTDDFVELFSYLNSVWADILERFIQELERQGKGLKNSERSINSTSDMFNRLSAIWYMRTVILLNFAKKHLSKEQLPSWKPSLLAPRAVELAGKNIPELQPMPDLDKMREEIKKHRS